MTDRDFFAMTDAEVERESRHRALVTALFACATSTETDIADVPAILQRCEDDAARMMADDA